MPIHIHFFHASNTFLRAQKSYPSQIIAEKKINSPFFPIFEFFSSFAHVSMKRLEDCMYFRNEMTIKVGN